MQTDKEKEGYHQTLLHDDISCSRCPSSKGAPLIGTRYKCVNCHSHNLCRSCYNKTIPDGAHTFLVLTEPMKKGKEFNFFTEDCLYQDNPLKVPYDQRSYAELRALPEELRFARLDRGIQHQEPVVVEEGTAIPWFSFSNWL